MLNSSYILSFSKFLLLILIIWCCNTFSYLFHFIYYKIITVWKLVLILLFFLKLLLNRIFILKFLLYDWLLLECYFALLTYERILLKLARDCWTKWICWCKLIFINCLKTLGWLKPLLIVIILWKFIKCVKILFSLKIFTLFKLF